MAKQKLENGEPTRLLKKQFHNKSAPKHQSGMICSGEQTNLIYTIVETDFTAVKNIVNTLQEMKTGTLSISPEGIAYADLQKHNNHHFEMHTEEDWKYEERLGFENHLYIVGAGHCALALSKIMAMMNFYVHVIDTRSELNTLEENEFAHEKKVVDDFEKLREIIPAGDDTYVVIMSVGYRTDDVALRSIMGRDFKYVGVLGSGKKIDKMFTDYKLEGLDEEWLSKVYSPIGLQIHSQTPEEIAISIAAEIIKVKNEPSPR
jgi:xanthine dehydrogenase accessory factor